MRKGNVEVLKKLWDEAKRITKSDRKFIAKQKRKSIDEILVERPWDKMNDEKHGKHNSSMLIFQDTIIPLFKGTPAEEFYNNSELQKQLAQFINEKLSDKVYKRGYKPKTEVSDPRIIEPQKDEPQTPVKLSTG